jgi:DNA ligase (NAD+)
VEIGGITVQHATLHNFDDIARKDIRLGDMVRIKRAGDVIPYVIGPIIDLRVGNERPVQTPTTCPSCREPVVRAEEEVAIYCDNPACPAQLVRRIEYWVSRGAMDIVGLGARIVEQLVDADLVHDVADLYTVKVEDLLQLDGFADKRARNLVAAIQDSKTQPLHRVLTALGVRSVGATVAQALMGPFGVGCTHPRRFTSLEALTAASSEDVQAIPGIGPHTAWNIIRWFAAEPNRALIRKLEAAGIRVRAEPARAAQPVGPLSLAGKTFVITGTLPTLSREQARELIEKHGGKVSESVSSNTNYVLCGEKPGSKLARAQALAIPVIDEAALRCMVQA